MEGRALALDPIGLAPGPHPGRRDLDRDVDQEGQVGRDAAGRDQAQLEQRLDLQPAPEALIGHGGVEEAVAQNGPPGLQGGLDQLADELRARGVEQHDLRDRIDVKRRVDEEGA